jgi:hypothetical protein
MANLGIKSLDMHTRFREFHFIDDHAELAGPQHYCHDDIIVN